MNKTIPDDLVVILAKDEEKQRQILEKASQDAASESARAIDVTLSASRMFIKDARSTAAHKVAVTPTVSKAPVAGTSTSAAKPVATKPAGGMYIQAIPPFKKRSPTPSHATTGATMPCDPNETDVQGPSSPLQASPPAVMSPSPTPSKSSSIEVSFEPVRCCRQLLQK